VKFIIMYSHFVVDYAAARESVNHGVRSPEGSTNLADLMGDWKGTKVFEDGEV